MRHLEAMRHLPITALALLLGCSAFDGDLVIASRPSAPPGPTQDGGQSPADSGSGSGDGGSGGRGSDGGTSTGGCPSCSDPCNGRDDDEDGATDEDDPAVACASEHASASCLDGECLVVQCDEGFRDCDGRAENGCELAIGVATACAACGDDCSGLANVAEASCSSERRCAIARCADGFSDCDGDASNGCEASFSDVLNCGGCASTGDAEACTELPGVLSASCERARCEVLSCLPGFVDCNARASDGCEQEIAVDGCCPGTADSDGDGVLDCLDGCKDDPDKTAPGACGCGTTDADMDRDGIADCRTDCWGFPSNFDPFDAALSFTATANLTCSPTIDSAKAPGAMITGWCNGDPSLPVTRTQSGVPSVVIVPLRGLTLAAGQRLRLVGDKPVILAVEGDARIEGVIDAGSQLRSVAGAGASMACSTGAGRAGANAVNDGAAGGGGGSFATAGGRGGSSDDGAGGAAGALTSSTLVPLRAGCAGGNGGADGSGGGAGGFGGGAVQLSVTGRLLVTGTGTIAASGGGGGRGTGSRDGGGGGGSGGAVLLEANLIELAQGAWVTANGGSGAAGNASSSVCANATGRDGVQSGSAPTIGGSGCNDSGAGGSGAAAGGAASNGGGSRVNEAAGGGGGGRGTIVMKPLAGSICAQ